MKRIIYIITLGIILSLTHLSAKAVTDKEMEQARTIATKAYLRYANDGSGYLDDVKATTMAELEKNLKPKEKENLKAFKAIPVPKDYKSWDKQKLVDYWGVKAFSTPGLVEKGRIGRIRAKKNINAMTISAPAKETSKEVAQASATQTSADTATTHEPKETAGAAKAVVNTDTITAADAAAVNTLEQTEAEVDAMPQIEDDPIVKKADNHTWVYVLILCILVGVVCALVIFASNVMRKHEESQTQREPLRISAEEASNSNALREKFAATLTAKNEEIKALSKKIESLNGQNATLKANLESLTAEIASLRNRLNSTQQSASLDGNARAQGALAEETVAHKTPSTSLRTIYLGRANSRGIFVRADRNLNTGNSIYRLDTTDGYAGSFRVANNPDVWAMALLSPSESLAGACVIANPDNAGGMTRIVNDSAGTAVLEGGCWKVIRKAKVHFE